MSERNPKVWLKPGREKPAAYGHPWVFSGAIARWEAREPATGGVDVHDHADRFVARGLACPGADLAVRLYTWDESGAVDAALFARRIASAAAMRRRLLPDDGRTDAYRVVFSEADGISGLIADRYGAALSVRVAAAGLVPFLGGILDALRAATGCTAAHVAADPDAVRRERLDAAAVAAHSAGVAGPVTVREHGFAFEVDLAGGQKTGFYLDQRENRRRVAARAAGRRVLSAYCYTGAFEVHCAAAGAASVTGIDVSAPALSAARRHLEANGASGPAEYLEGDVPVVLRAFRDAGRTFDLVILDPPRFVVKADQLEKGLRAYKDINLLAAKLLTPGGLLATFSCSGLVKSPDLRMALAWAARDAGRTLRIVEQLGPGPDHPILPAFPESDYLCGFLCHVDG